MFFCYSYWLLTLVFFFVFVFLMKQVLLCHQRVIKTGQEKFHRHPVSPNDIYLHYLWHNLDHPPHKTNCTLGRLWINSSLMGAGAEFLVLLAWGPKLTLLHTTSSSVKFLTVSVGGGGEAGGCFHFSPRYIFLINGNYLLMKLTEGFLSFYARKRRFQNFGVLVFFK